MKRKVTRLEGLAWGFLTGMVLGFILALALLFTSNLVSNIKEFWIVGIGCVVLASGFGWIFPRAAKIVGTIASLLPM